MFKGGHKRCQFLHIIQCNSAASRVVIELDLHKARQRLSRVCGRLIDPAREPLRVDSMYICKVHSMRGFVGLQMADQMEARVRKSQLRQLFGEFLYPVFAEVSQAALISGSDDLGRKCLSYGN